MNILWVRKRKYGKCYVKGRDSHEQIWQLALLFGFLGIFEQLKKISCKAHGFYNCYWNVFDTTIFLESILDQP
jgi:hypothetical protein